MLLRQGNPKHRAVSLFAGICGLDLGLGPCDSQISQGLFWRMFPILWYYKVCRNNGIRRDPIKHNSLWLPNHFCSSQFQVPVFVIEVERDPFCRKVIASRIKDGFYNSHATVHNDVETFELSHLSKPESITGLHGGFPCQAGCVQTVDET